MKFFEYNETKMKKRVIKFLANVQQAGKRVKLGGGLL
jgi:hypothetical protein